MKFILPFLIIPFSSCYAQTKEYSKDVTTVDATIAALYDVISRERELYRTTEQYGTIVHVFSTHEPKEKQDGPVTNRGINSIQLFFDGKHYSIVDIYWCAEGLEFPLPEKYVK